MSEHVTEHKHGGLKELEATAICGNDITSSCLYVSALAILQAGKWAPVALLIVGAVLYLFRSVYGEVVGALPLNGGAYNALLNTTSKSVASLAACLTLLSYMATAVISANEAMHYAHSVFHGLPVVPATVVLLAIFMGLSILGIGESAKVAVAIFITHLVALTLLLVAGGLYLLTHGTSTLQANLAAPSERGIMAALFFGFAAAMLGISGFESSANFVEEQAEGVFPKTLRNMWAAVTFFNPAIALLALALVPLALVGEHQEALLAHIGVIAGGDWWNGRVGTILSTLISVDATLVLSGAVLTSYVGVTGLIRRMTLDRVLPQLFLVTTRRGTSHRIIIAFFLLAVSVLLITKGELGALAGVYTISFLSVMVLFGLGNILLKVRRERLPRPEHAGWPGLLIGIVAVLIGLVGNVIMNPAYTLVFANYFIPTLLIVTIMLKRTVLLKVCLFFVRGISVRLRDFTGAIARSIREKIEQVNSQQIVFFTRGDSVANLNQALLYVRRNEETNRIKVVTVVQDDSDVPERMAKDLEFLDEVYPEIDIEFVVVHGHFGPEIVERLSEEWKIPQNFMFIGSPGDHFLYGLAELGGVRLII
jgi:amino acid transporter